MWTKTRARIEAALREAHRLGPTYARDAAAMASGGATRRWGGSWTAERRAKFMQSMATKRKEKP